MDNVESVQGYLEDIPLPDASVDVVTNVLAAVGFIDIEIRLTHLVHTQVQAATIRTTH